jgi:hypothetical protein
VLVTPQHLREDPFFVCAWIEPNAGPISPARSPTRFSGI